MNDNIKDKTIIITGASSGLGEAAARHLSGLGATVILAARRFEKIKSLEKELLSNGASALAIKTDVTLYHEVNELIKKTIEQFGKVDVIINNAGIMPLSPLEHLQIDEWSKMIDINIKGVLHGIAAVLPIMKEQRFGQIINVSSVSGHKVGPASAVYAATKHAVRALSEGLRQEVKPYNIRTTIISPGAVLSELPNSVSDSTISDAIDSFYKNYAIPSDSFAKVVAFAICQPDEVDINEILFRPTRQEL